MPVLTIRVAKAQLSQLIEAALSGEDVVIVKGDKPVVRLVPVSPGRFKFGVLEPGAIGDGRDFRSPKDEDEFAVWQGRT
jgi:prevent-host-death family protein